MYNRNYEIDMESVAAYLKDAVNKVKTQENPDVLNDIKKTFKKSHYSWWRSKSFDVNKAKIV